MLGGEFGDARQVGALGVPDPCDGAHRTSPAAGAAPGAPGAPGAVPDGSALRAGRRSVRTGGFFADTAGGSSSRRSIRTSWGVGAPPSTVGERSPRWRTAAVTHAAGSKVIPEGFADDRWLVKLASFRPKLALPKS
ncbi:hypothetical protein Saso_19690 [Streptomyces asoensis]|uniref:Uncharacterized protein n=1 Tax=Streptomyces asoensis TaxID=249586 RepID=A0ABQ3RWS6_9ACTN|nr:hypothetical protein GCM10010496_12280 [Streptomyces asoensis]GHI60319.1 hypothetical protein Saso_19690 [Streptomyces asoensis]